MTEANQSGQVEALLASFADLVDSDELIGEADEFLNEADALASSVHATGVIPIHLIRSRDGPLSLYRTQICSTRCSGGCSTRLPHR